MADGPVATFNASCSSGLIMLSRSNIKPAQPRHRSIEGGHDIYTAGVPEAAVPYRPGGPTQELAARSVARGNRVAGAAKLVAHAAEN